MNSRPLFSTQIFLTCLFLTLVAVVISTAYIFFIKKDYAYVVEAACDPATTSCYFRDCSEEDACYEYQEEVYKIFEVPASEFEKCGGLSCAEQCESGAIACEEVACDAETEECYVPEETQENEAATELDAEG